MAKCTKLLKKCTVYQLIKFTKNIKCSIFVLLTVRNGSPEVEFVQRPLLINKRTEKTFLKTFLRKILGKVSTIFELSVWKKSMLLHKFTLTKVLILLIKTFSSHKYYAQCTFFISYDRELTITKFASIQIYNLFFFSFSVLKI